MKTEKSQSQPSGAEAESAQAGVAVSSRRGLLKGLGVGSPILLTLSSAPVQAASVCIMPSGYISAATFNSRHQGATVCTVQGPTFFKNSIGDSTYWPTSPSPDTQTTQFRNSSLFRSAPDGSIGNTQNDSMAQVLSGSYASDFTKYCIAAYLNARNPPTDWPAGVTTTRVIELWRYVKAGGPPPGWIPAAWTPLDAQAWLSTLMGP